MVVGHVPGEPPAARRQAARAGTAATTGVASPQLATRMVREFGLSPELGPVGYATGGPMFLGGGEQVWARPYAEATQRVIDSEVARLIRDAEHTAVELLRTHRPDLDTLVELLLEHETVDGARVYDIVGRPVPGEAESPLTSAHRTTATGRR